jgi:hypothetical protein
MEKSICFVMSLQLLWCQVELMLWIADPIRVRSSCCEAWRKRKSISKASLEEAKAIANTNVGIFSQVISSDTPLME